MSHANSPASTGPPPEGGGRARAGKPSPAVVHSRFNGAASRRRRKAGWRRRSHGRGVGELQRGRLPKEAEGAADVCFVMFGYVASTGPPPEGGGRVSGALTHQNYFAKLQRGRLPKEAEGIVQLERTGLTLQLQRGRLPKEAEGPPKNGLRPTCGTLQRGRLPKEAEGCLPQDLRTPEDEASTGPPPEGGGRAASRAVLYQSQSLLQRGRLPKEAEGRSWVSLASLRKRFNGAASRRRRKALADA